MKHTYTLYVHTYTRTHGHTPIRTHVHTYTRVCVCVYPYVFVYPSQKQPSRNINYYFNIYYNFNISRLQRNSNGHVIYRWYCVIRLVWQATAWCPIAAGCYVTGVHEIYMVIHHYDDQTSN